MLQVTGLDEESSDCTVLTESDELETSETVSVGDVDRVTVTGKSGG